MENRNNFASGHAAPAGDEHERRLPRGSRGKEEEPPSGGGKRRPWLWFVFATALIVLFTASFTFTLAYGFITGIQDEIDGDTHPDFGDDGESDGDGVIPVRREPLSPGEPMRILILGVDVGVPGSRSGVGRSDAVMVLTVDTVTGHVGLLSIPRDTHVHIPQYAIDELIALRGRNTVHENPTKMGHPMAYGGPMLAMATASELLGVDIKRYVRVDFRGFERIIDLLGGVEIDVPQDMYYEDEYQDLIIDLKKGRQVLNGRQAHHFVRFRDDGRGDIGRIGRQQQFIRALVDQSLRLNTISRLPDITDELVSHMGTNLTGEEIVNLVGFATRQAIGFSVDDVEMGMVPGKLGWGPNGEGLQTSYWYPDEEKLWAEIDRVVLGVNAEHSHGVRLAVHNASGDRRLGQIFQSRFEDLGYDIDEVVMEGPTADTTTVIDHHVREEVTGQMVARIVGTFVPTAEFYLQFDEDPEVDITIVIGRDAAARIFGGEPVIHSSR